MLNKRCTQERAEQIYLSTLEKNKLLKSENGSPVGSRTRVSGVNGEEHPQFLGMKSIYENIIHAASPSRAGSRAGSKSQSRIYSKDTYEEEKLGTTR